MHPRQRRRLIAGAVIALLAILAVTLYFTVFRTSTHSNHGVTVAKETIPVDGADLAAEVVTPRGVHHPPLIVMPGSFGGSAETYRAVSTLFARKGYQVVAYGQRGFGGSTGKVDFAGPATQRDARDVITWALAHTHADANRVAMFGMSYGGGISLLTAAHDPRVKAVAALSTWADLAATYTDLGTPHTYALRSVLGGQDKTPLYDSTVRKLQSTLLDRPADLGPVLHGMSAVRSPDTYVKQLNKNKPAIMIANAFEDSYFGPSQLIPFFDKLTGPKRLELAAGDHGGPERSALTGAQNEVIDDVRAWFDHYLRGIPNRINNEEPIVVKDVRTGELKPLASWPVATKADRVELPRPSAAGATSTTWIATIKAGTDSGANSGQIEIVPSTSYRPPMLRMSDVNPKTAFIWTGQALGNGLQLTGTPSLTVNIAASAPTATLYLYLYDVTSDGVGSLVDMQPYTATGLKPVAVPQTISMQPISWSVPPGDHLALVVDTVDPHYQSLTPPGTTITVTSNKKNPASFSAPATR